MAETSRESGTNSDNQQSDGSASGGKLQANALGLLSTAALTAAYMGPALSIYALFGPMTASVGQGVGFVMLLGMFMTLPSAISFGMLAKELPSAGGIYAWSRVALGESIGLWIGLMAAGYYTICLMFPPIVFGQFFSELVQQIGLIKTPGFGTFLMGAMILLVVAGSVSYRGIVVSSHLAFTLLMTELAVIVALAFTFMGSAIIHHTFSWVPFTFGGCKGGWTGIFAALPMAFLSLACDGVTPASEETRNAKWTIPVAVVLTCLIVGLWYIVGFSAFAMGGTIPSGEGYLSVITPMAGRMWGSLKILVTITAMTAAMGAFIPGSIAASRVLFAMSRDGRLPSVLGALHPKYRSPWTALHVLYATVVLAVLPACYVSSPDTTITWWSWVFGWFIAVVYVAANTSNIIFYFRDRRSQFSWMWNLVVPAVGIAAQLLLVWLSVIVDLWRNQGTAGRIVQGCIALVSLLLGGYALMMKGRGFRSADAASRGAFPVEEAGDRRG